MSGYILKNREVKGWINRYNKNSTASISKLVGEWR
nr:MAG TPA: hypothetical protein [Bacteriophage sp.]